VSDRATVADRLLSRPQVDAEQADADARVIAALESIVAQHGPWGSWKCFTLLRALGNPWNHKRVYRVYRARRLNQVRRTKKRVPKREVVPLQAPAQLHHAWAMDFMGDSLYSGRSYRVLNILDEGNREALAIKADFSPPSTRVVELLEDLVTRHGVPRQLRCDNGLEFIAEALRAWCVARWIILAFIEPGKPNQNAYIERFKRTFREEVLDAWAFTTLEEVRAIDMGWRYRYNIERVHESLGNVPPLSFLPRATQATESNFKLCA
jgi:putative transposase